MPNYEFTCRQCKKSFVLRRKFSEMHDAATCPKCGKDDTRRNLTVFYATNTGSSTAAASAPKTKIRHV